MEDEIWKTIEEFPNYAISNKGEVINKKTKQILKPGLCGKNRLIGKGYYMVSLRYEGKSYTRKIHRLLAQAFIPNPNNLPYVDHIDNDSLNNILTNLRWVSHNLNCHNISAYGKYNYKGVNDADSNTNPYMAKINHNGNKIYLGLFKTPEEAAIAYNKKAYEIYGDNARLNILPDNYYFM